MRQTRWIYGVAGLSWALAFLVPFPSPSVVPPPATESAPTSLSNDLLPITTLHYGNEVVEVEARLNRGHLSADADAPLFMDLELKGLGDAAGGKLTTLLLLDRSGSMAGDKIEAARQSAERLLYQLEDGDRFGIVSYGSEVNVDLPLTTIDPLSRSVARRTLQRLEEGGGTHLEGGLATAFRLLSGEDLRQRIGRILLISDGRPTEGSKDIARFQKWAHDFRSLGVSISTIGVGCDYDAELLAALAEGSSGRFHDLRDASRLGRVLQDEIRHANHIVARQVYLRFPEPLRTWAKPALADQRAEKRHGPHDIWVGDIAAGETRHVLMQIEIPQTIRATKTAVSFAAPELVYRRPARQVDESLSHASAAFLLTPSADFSYERDVSQKKVEAQATQMLYSQRLVEAMRQLEQGQMLDARRTLENEVHHLQTLGQQTQNPQLQDESAALRRVLNELNEDAGTGSALPGLTKQQREHAMKLRR